MGLRAALILIALAAAACPSSEAAQSTPADRAAAADHQRCIKNGFRPHSSDYAACRQQLATKRAEERSDANDPIWWLRKSHDRACRFWGYEAGTAAFTDCLRRMAHLDERSRKEDACLKSGTGLVTSLGGSSFIVNCFGTIVNCPGHISCPVCPGSIGCPK